MCVYIIFTRRYSSRYFDSRSGELRMNFRQAIHGIRNPVQYVVDGSYRGSGVVGSDVVRFLPIW